MLRASRIAIAIAFASPALLAQVNLAVASMSPTPHSIGASNATSITLRFNAPLLASTIHSGNARVAGRLSGDVPGTWSVDAPGTRVVFRPSRPYFAGEFVQLMLSRSVQSATGAALHGGFTAGFFAGASAGSSVFALDRAISFRRPGEGAIGTYGFFAGDIDRDGSPDMSATNELSFDVRLLKNDGCGGFPSMTRIAMPPSSQPSPNEGGDLNGDGWLDLVTGNQFGRSMAVFLNDGAGNYLAPVVYPVGGGSVHGIALLDAEGDGDLDAFVPNRSQVLLLLNAGNGSFGTPIPFEAGNEEYTVATGDANGDGFFDLFCGASVGGTVSVLLGDGLGGYSLASTTPSGGYAWAMALGDLNRDGRLDCLIANHFQARLAVLLGNGDGTLQAPQTYFIGTGTRPLSVDVADLDGDGDLDVTTANFGTGDTAVLRNDGTGLLAAWTVLPASQAGSCNVLADFDRDGDLDICVVDEYSDEGYLYLQQGPSPSGIAAPTCGSALRLDNLAPRAGYGNQPAHSVDGATTLFLGLSGAPHAPFLLLGGDPGSPPLPTAFGPLSLSVLAPLFVFATSNLDAFGEATLALPLPPGIPAGAQLAFQGLVVAGAAVQLTNPELARVR